MSRWEVFIFLLLLRLWLERWRVGWVLSSQHAQQGDGNDDDDEGRWGSL